ncbi:MAG: bacteriohemerythrin [Rhodospirillales bacterium]|nr:bacteriohemerythrin [Rhodospirillales bacterium]
MLIEWDESWRVGHPEVDYDHMMLVNITNELHFMRNRRGVKHIEIRRTLANLIKYVERHFAREEAIFCATDYPEAERDRHIAKHRELEKAVRDIASLFAKQPDLLNFDEIMVFLRDWLTLHICKHDMGYREWLGTGKPATAKGKRAA